jgi:hypothetical protein
VNGVEVLAYFAAELGEFGNAAPGGPFQPPVGGTFAVLALELEGSRSPCLQQPGPVRLRVGLGDPGVLALLAGLAGGAGLPPGFAADLVDGGMISTALDAAAAADCPWLSVESR